MSCLLGAVESRPAQEWRSPGGTGGGGADAGQLLRISSMSASSFSATALTSSPEAILENAVCRIICDSTSAHFGDAGVSLALAAASAAAAPIEVLWSTPSKSEVLAGN